MRSAKKRLLLIANLAVFLPTAHAVMTYGLSNFNNDSPEQILLNQASSGFTTTLKSIQQYYEENHTLPSANAFQHCASPPSLIGCITNDANGGVVITFSSAAYGILSTNNPIIRLVLGQDSDGTPDFGSFICVTTIGNNALLNQVPNFVASPTIMGSNFGRCYYAPASAVTSMSYAQLSARINSATVSNSSVSSNTSTASIG